MLSLGIASCAATPTRGHGEGAAGEHGALTPGQVADCLGKSFVLNGGYGGEGGYGGYGGEGGYGDYRGY